MNSKILILMFVACYQLATAQRPTVISNPLGIGATPPFLGAVNNNWARPFYTAAAEGWRTYFQELQNARNQFYQTQNGGLQSPATEVPVQNDNKLIQTVTRPTLPQVQNDVQQAPAQGQSGVNNNAAQGSNPGRQPQTTGVNAPTRPLNSQITSGVVPPIGSQIIPQIIPQVPSWVGK